ncbi:MAG TPA: biotin carboxylase N-terminal domain-containing protein, partial [bacterium]|nr:biotin carboxylase N-terminal domain-containing protein [bacterium]
MENYNSSNRPILKDDAVIGIINRGECAYRFIRSVQEYNIENNTALKTVAFYIDDDKDAPFVKYADYSCNFNKIPMASQSKGNIYINKNVLLKALDIMNCDAVWVGWGFVSEDSEFAELIEKSGRVLLGPSSFSMAQLGDKITAKELAEKSGVPILPWSKKSVKTIDEAKIYAKQIGYPVIIKAANTGGGRGIRFAYSEQEIEKQFTAAREETIRITGDDIVFMEHFIETGRHLEVQIAADRYGNVYSFGVRDCSVQRKNQKIIEETPPVNISRETLEDMQKSARALIKTAKYESVGTVEFIYCMKTEKFYFMEVNTRLQVEHPITEQLYNIDLIKIQIEVARGKELKFENLQPRGCAIELRLNAEDAENNFTPAPGKILNYKIPAGAGIRIDSGIDSGSTIPTKFDSMIAKIIGYGQSRSEVLSRLERALDEINILIDGGATNRAFLKALLKNPDIRKGAVSTRFVEELLQKTPKIIERKNWHLAMIATAIEQFAKKYIDDINNFKNQFNRGGYLKTLELTSDKEITISHNGVNYNFFIEYVGNDIFHIKINGKNIVVKYIWEQNESIMFFYNKRFIVQMIERGNITQCELNGTPYPFELEAKGIIKSPTPAMVLSIPVKKGDRISQGQLLIVLEAMKMESAVTAPADGIISEILVREGEQIAAGQILIKI